jgi:hypothetical protein
MKPYIEMLKDNCYSGKTWVIMGSGPSLLDHTGSIVWAEEQGRDDLVFLAINGALRFMNPDIFFTEDRHGDMDWYEGCEKIEDKPNLVTHPMCDPSVLNYEWKDRFYFTDLATNDESESFSRLGWLEAGKVAMSQAMDLAVRCGAKKIILIGADHALREDGVNHFYDKPTNPDLAQMLHSGWVCVEGIDGKPCYINGQYYHTACLIEGFARVIEEEAGVPVFNCSGRGIVKDHVRLASFQEAVEWKFPVEELNDASRRNDQQTETEAVLH